MPSTTSILLSSLSAASALQTVEWRTGNAKVDSLIEQLTPAEKISLVHGSNDPGDQQQAGYIVPVSRLGIPAMRLSDGEAGINVVNDATAIPVQLNVANTWSKSAAYAAGKVTGQEAYLLGNGIALAPRVNVLRDPITGNYWQSYSEDPFLNAQLGIQGVAGIQDQDTMANAKQIGPSSTGASSGDTNSIVDMQTLQEVYWSAPGALLAEGQAATLMCSYAQINGVPACQYQPLFDTVRDEYNSTAIVMSDWLATHSTGPSIIAGMDLEMPQGTYYGQPLNESIYVAKNLSETYLNRALGHILGKYDAFGYLDGKAPATPNFTAPLPASMKQSSAEVAYDIAVKSGVLLRNSKHALPISENASFAVIGPNGVQYSHGTNFAERAYGFPDRQISPLHALESRTGRSDVPSAVGIDQEGTLIPSSALINLNGTSGLSRNDTLRGSAVDSSVDFTGANALPANRSYEWQGFLDAPEAGLYTISLQRAIPSSAGKTNDDYGIQFALGSISVNGSSAAEGYRLLGDGGVKPWSNSIATHAGWDNIKATVYLSEGKHAFSAMLLGLLHEPIEAKLCWVTPTQREKNIQAAVDLAKTVKIPLVFAFANSPAQVGLTLDDGQDELVSRVAAANPNTVVVLNNAEPVLMPWLNSVAAVLEMGYAGQEGGYATADLILGNHVPQGKLVVTYPASRNQTLTRDPAHPERVATPDGNATFSEGVNVGYRYYKATNTPVSFPFGFGLSYTTFKYSDLRIQNSNEQPGSWHGSWSSPSRKQQHQQSTSIEVSYPPSGPDSLFTVSFTVANTGSVCGVEIPQIYIGPPKGCEKQYPGVQFAAITLVGWDNVKIDVGGKVEVSVGIPRKQLSFYDVGTRKWVVAQGERDIWIGGSVDDVRLGGRVKI